MVSLFLLLGCNLSYIVDLLAALHEPASASARTLLKLASSVRALLKGHCHGILASFYNAEIFSCINGNPKIIMHFCYLGLYHYTETSYC